MLVSMLLAWAILASRALAVDTGAGEWSRFRGPEGNGISPAKHLPVQWGEKEVRWRTELPGKGHSSPVVWGNRVFVTSGRDTDAERYVVCVQKSDGKVLWEKHYPSQTYHQHKDDNYGSSTPVVDENTAYVYWATPQAITVLALSHDGQEKWRKNLGPFTAQRGAGVSPVLCNQTVWINNDQEGPSSLIGLDAKTGNIKYKLDRMVDKASYGTPVPLAREGRPEELIFAASSHGLTSVNPQTGAVNWDCTNLYKARVVSSPITSDGLVICSSGEGGVGKRLVVVRPPASKGAASVLYDFTKGVPNVPTPLAKDGRLFILCDNGLLRCVNTATGAPIWEEKIEEPFYASPVWAAGRLYLVSRAGTVYVVSAGDKYELLGKASLGEATSATPAIADETLFFRTLSHLMAVGGKM